MTLVSLGDESFDFDELADLYQAHGALNPPSEWHGMLCGKLMGGAKLSEDNVISLAIEHMGVDKLLDVESAQLLVEIFGRLEKSIRADDMSFKPLLPEDEFALSERVEALSHWVRGFLEGVALQMGPTLMEKGDDIREILQDLVEISQIDSDIDEDDASEIEFMEVVEHVRMSVLSLYFSCDDGESSKQPKAPTIH